MLDRQEANIFEQYFKVVITELSEEKALESLDKYLSCHGVKSINDITVFQYEPVDNIAVNVSLLTIACLLNYTTFVQRLLDAGASILTTSKSRYLKYDNLSPIFFSIEEVTLKVILSHARKYNLIDELFNIKCTFNSIDVFAYHTRYANFKMLYRLITDESFASYNNILGLLGGLTSITLTNKDFSLIYNLLRNKLKSMIKRSIPPSFTLFPNDDQLSGVDNFYDINECHVRLFGSKMSVYNPDTQLSALMRANAQFYYLLSNPVHCLDHLKIINREFKLYCKKTMGEDYQITVDPDSFTFEIIDGLYIPIPKPGSLYEKHDNITQYNKKYSTLTKFMHAYLKRYGLGEKTVKWVGFIPKEIANATVAQGHLFTESYYNGSIFHNPYSHAIQTLIMLIAIDRGEIQLRYTENGKDLKLSPLELLASQVSLHESNDTNKALIWSIMRDYRHYLSLHFSDPHRLASSIMHDGATLGIKDLANFMIDSFCKGAYKIYNEYIKHNPNLTATCTEFLNMLGDMNTANFYDEEFLITKAAQKYRYSPRYFISKEISGKYAIAERNIETTI